MGDEDEEPSGTHEVGAQYDRLYGAIASLTPALREVVRLELDGFSTQEMAQVLGCSQVAVRQRRARARAELKKVLSETPDSAE